MAATLQDQQQQQHLSQDSHDLEFYWAYHSPENNIVDTLVIFIKRRRGEKMPYV
jgi:hypothetical protein